jgi:hypothetical protein
MNEDGQCFPREVKCPAGYWRADDDETGAKYCKRLSHRSYQCIRYLNKVLLAIGNLILTLGGSVNDQYTISHLTKKAIGDSV